MALTSEAIAAIFELDYGTNKAVVDMMRDRIAARLAPLAATPMLQRDMEIMVKEELEEWQSNIKFTRESKPTTTEGWRGKVDACIDRADMRLERGRKLDDDLDDDLMEAARAIEEQHLKEAARMDRESVIKLEESPKVAPLKKAQSADMGEMVVARLGASDVIGTDHLSTCAGVTLFDPVTKVGAVMHVYDGTRKPTIHEALLAMKAVDTTLDPSRLQVTLMPGTFKGGDQSHLESLRKELRETGTPHVRDFSKEGRTSSTLQLRGDGLVISSIEAEKLTLASEGAGSLSSRARSDSVDSTYSLGPPPPTPENLPPLPDSPKVAPSSITARALPEPLTLGPPPPGPENLPPLPDSPEPEVDTRKRTPSVGEVLGIGKRSSTSTSLGQGVSQGAGTPATGGKVRV